MPNTVGAFDYELAKMGRDCKPPFSPFILLCLKSYGRTTGDGAPTFSANLMTEQEIDAYVGFLKADLDAVAKRAKRALISAQEQTRELMAQRTVK